MKKELDLNKPVRWSDSSKAYRKDNKLKHVYKSSIIGMYICEVFDVKTREYVSFHVDQSEIENVPQSRWLNVYAEVNDCSEWCESLEEANDMYFAHGCIGVLEDKQDGSEYIFHSNKSIGR